MPVEIDENELSRLQGASKLLQDLLGHKDTSSVTHQAIKKIHPGYKVPLPDADSAREEAREIAKQVVAEDRKKETDAKLEKDFQDALDSYRLSSKNPNGYTEEGIEKIKTLMRERTIADVHAAVAYMEKINPAKSEPPSGYVPTGWNFGAKGDDDKKQLFEDPDAWADKEARKVWDEFRKGEAA